MAERANKLANRLVKIVINFPLIKPVSVKLNKDGFLLRKSSMIFMKKDSVRANLPWQSENTNSG